MYNYSLLTPKEKIKLRNGTDSALYLYHGSAYTLPSHRNKGISTQLLTYAFDSITSKFDNKTFLVLLYGQVLANRKNKAMIHVFADTIQKTLPYNSTNTIQLHHMSCTAYKPDFDTNGNLQMVYDQLHEGRGSMVVYKARH